MRRALLMLVVLLGCGGPVIVPAGVDEGALDTRADPCADFYQYACGGWVSAHPVPEGGAQVSRRSGAYFATQTAVQTLLAETMTSASMTPQAQLLRAYNTACLAAAPSNRTEVRRLLAVVDAVSPDGGLERAVADLHAAGVDALFGFDSTLDVMQSKQIIARVYDTGIGLPDRAYYVDPAKNEVLVPYRAHVGRLAAQVGVFDPALADAAIAVETALASAMLETQAYRDALMTYHPTALADFVLAHPRFDWAAYFSTSGAPPFASLNVTLPAFFAAVDAVLATTSLDDLKRYLRWRVIEAAAFQLEDAVIAEEYQFHFGTFYGFTTPLPRKELCTRRTVQDLDWEMSSLYVARNASGLAGRVQPMVDTIRDRFWEDFGRLDWLDAPTRDALRTKLDAMHTGVSAPADFSPYLVGPLVLPAEFAAAASALAARERQVSLQQIGSTWSRDWFMSPVTVNAAYHRYLNAINMPAAILQPPFYKTSFPDAVNYGAIGAVIGHELTHGFDDQGRRYDPGGALRNMWPQGVEQAFSDRAQCVVEQYSAIEGTPGMKINGALTVGENIADLGGVKLAYLALAPKGEKLESFTDAQVFFLAYAQAWCSNTRPEYLSTLLLTDPHSPPQARVNAVLADTPEFAAAWSCKEGQPMAPKNRCTVW